MIILKLAFLLVLVCSIPVFHAYGQLADKPAQGILREGIVGVKFLDAYFGTSTERMEFGPGDKNVPFTISLANVGTQDLTGIKGQLVLPAQFSSTEGYKGQILADNNQKATIRWFLSGKHSKDREEFGKKTDKDLFIMGINHAELRDYKVIREWVLFDEVAIWKQILM